MHLCGQSMLRAAPGCEAVLPSAQTSSVRLTTVRAAVQNHKAGPDPLPRRASTTREFTSNF